MKRHLLIIIALFCVLTGCKLDEDGFKQNSTPPVAIVGTTNSLLTGMWFVKSTAQASSPLGNLIDIGASTAYTANDYFIFKSDNTVNVSTSYAGSSTGTYSYNSDTKILTMAGNGETDEYTVNQLTANSLIMTFKVEITVNNSVSYTYLTYKLTH
jgi:hypothetical protein